MPINADYLVPFQGALGVTLLMPVVFTLFTPRQWHQGFVSRELLVVTSVFVAVCLIVQRDLTLRAANLDMFLLFESLWIGLSVLIGINGLRWRLTFIALLFLSATLCFLFFNIKIISNSLFNIIRYVLILLLLLPIVISIIRLIYSSLRALSSSNYSRAYFGLSALIMLSVLWLTVLIWMFILWRSIESMPFLGLLGLTELLLAASPSNFWSRQISHLRNILKFFRYDRLFDFASPLISPPRTLAWSFRHRIVRYLSLDNRSLFFTLSLLFGGIFVPIYGYVTGEKDLLKLMVLGVSGSLVLAASYLTLWFIRHRSRYIVTQFEVIRTDDAVKEPELEAIAHLATHILVEELQQISLLLKQRQVEQVNLEADDSNAFFVTSGIEQEFIDQMQQIVNLETPNTGGVALGQLAAVGTRLLARILVRGKVQRRKNGSVEIWVELNYRNDQTVTVDEVLLPRDSIDEIDQVFMRPVARELALKLFIELGKVTHLGSSWESLAEFLIGLRASSQHNWWQAIAHYRKALQIEETVRGSYGIGHYHLGSALIYQGDWDGGVEHLHSAETEGPPMAETHYMLALVLLYRYWGELHKKHKIFQTIDYHCSIATTLRRDFPEAQQLRGLAYFRRGRLQERTFTRTYLTSTQEDQARYLYKGFRLDYEQALRYLSYALRAFDNKQGITSYSVYYEKQNQEEREYFIRQRMTVTHQIGDALRSLGRYSEAETYYRDVLIIFSRNLRTLTDLAKTYCLSRNWQQSMEFLENIVFEDKIAPWDVDVAVHMGWTLVGAVTDDWLGLVRGKISQLHEGVREAFQYLDFAIHQCPRYITTWRQNDWLTEFQKAVKKLGATPQDLNVDFGEFCTETSKLEFFCCWLELRMQSYGHPQTEWHRYKESFFNQLQSNSENKKYDAFREIYSELNKFRLELVSFSEGIQKTKRVGGLPNTFRRLKYARALYEIWKKAENRFNELTKEFKEGSENPTFSERWVVDVYAEVALLTARMLSEGGAFSLLANEVAPKALSNLCDWILRWQAGFKDTHDELTEYYTFSPRTLRYQRATLYAWKAYSEYQCEVDFLAHAFNLSAPRTNAKHGDKVFIGIQNDIDKARDDVLYHPLALFVQALVYRRHKLYGQAIEEFERLLDLISPYDPKQNLGDTQFSEISPEPTSDKNRSQMYFMEKISGRQQFDDIINPANIHMEIARTYDDMKQSQLSIKHLMEAARWSPHHDQNVDNFLRMANQLNNTERYQEALALTEALRIPDVKLKGIKLSDTKRRAYKVIEAVVNTRRGRFTSAIDNCKSVARDFEIRSDQDYINELYQGIDQDFDGLNEIFKSATHELGQYGLAKERVGEVVRNTWQWINSGLGTPENSGSTGDTITGIIQKGVDFYDPEKPGFPRIFEHLHNMNQISLINTCAEWARFALCSDDLVRLLQELRSPLPVDTSEFDLVMRSHIYLFLAKQARNQLLQIAEICNALAYSRSEVSGLKLQYAYSDSFTALVIMHFLTMCTDHDSRNYFQYREKLAQYCDTLGWIYYRDALSLSHMLQEDSVSEVTAPKDVVAQGDQFVNWKKLDYAEWYLYEGIRYDQDRAIIHYHLARLHLSRIEAIWELYPAGLVSDNIAGQVRNIDVNIAKALNHWRIAKNSDSHGRLHDRLLWLYSRINNYKSVWEQRQFRAIGGLVTNKTTPK